jgi:hypothetical protein
MKQNKMQELYDLTKKFNTLSGAINEVSEKSFIEQYTYIREEFKEMAGTLGDDLDSFNSFKKLSLETYMIEPLLDDCLDVIITAFGMLQKLEVLGVDVGEAAIATALNNLSKYAPSPAIAYKTVEKLLIEKSIQAEAKFNEEHNCYVIRNKASGKVCKPMDFVSNDLSVFITDEVKENYNARG